MSDDNKSKPKAASLSRHGVDGASAAAAATSALATGYSRQLPGIEELVVLGGAAAATTLLQRLAMQIVYRPQFAESAESVKIPVWSVASTAKSATTESKPRIRMQLGPVGLAKPTSAAATYDVSAEPNSFMADDGGTVRMDEEDVPTVIGAHDLTTRAERRYYEQQAADAPTYSEDESKALQAEWKRAAEVQTSTADRTASAFWLAPFWMRRMADSKLCTAYAVEWTNRASTGPIFDESVKILSDRLKIDLPISGQNAIFGQALRFVVAPCPSETIDNGLMFDTNRGFVLSSYGSYLFNDELYCDTVVSTAVGAADGRKLRGISLIQAWLSTEGIADEIALIVVDYLKFPPIPDALKNFAEKLDK
jgi:hypothetical protein